MFVQNILRRNDQRPQGHADPECPERYHQQRSRQGQVDQSRVIYKRGKKQTQLLHF